MLVTSSAYAEEPTLTSDEFHDTAVIFAKCSGYWKAMSIIMEKNNKPAAAEDFKGSFNGWAVASWMLFSTAHDPKGTKAYGAWADTAESYAETAKSHMAFLIEKNDTEEAQKLMAVCHTYQDIQVELVEDFRKRAYVGKAMED